MIKATNLIPALLCALGILLNACGPGRQLRKEVAPADLKGVVWLLHSYEFKDELHLVNYQDEQGEVCFQKFLLQFLDKGIVKSDLNNGFFEKRGRYKLNGNRFEFLTAYINSEMSAKTGVHCGLDVHEIVKYDLMLGKAESFERKNDELIIRYIFYIDNGTVREFTGFLSYKVYQLMP